MTVLTSAGVDSAGVVRSNVVASLSSGAGSFGKDVGPVEVVVDSRAKALAAEFVAAASTMLSTAMCMTPSAVAPVVGGDPVLVVSFGMGLIIIMNYLLACW